MEEDKCTCKKLNPIVLQFNFTNNPLVCSKCNLGFNVKNLSTGIKEYINTWNDKYEKNYIKWLNSDECNQELNNPSSDLNSLGFSIVSILNESRLSYYWWHINENQRLEFCPKCSKALSVKIESKNGSTKICKSCKILIKE